MTTTDRSILHIHLHGLAPADTERYEQVLTLLRDITPAVQALPPDAVVIDITGARRYFGQSTEGLAHLVRLRVTAYTGLHTTIGAGPNRGLAAMAAAVTPPGELRTIADDPAAIRSFLRPRPVGLLHGVGPATAKTLTLHGLHTIGNLADVPLLTLQRLLGISLGRALHEAAHGHDNRPVLAEPIAQSVSAEHRFTTDELDPVEHHRALLTLTGHLGAVLRADRKAAEAMALTVRYADGSTTTRSRTLPEATAHSFLLTRTAYDLYATLSLQRARVRAISLRAQGLRAAGEAPRQLTFDPDVDRSLVIEAVADEARRRYGNDAIKPASLAYTPR
ncbi:hypothetical protein [Streptomyces sp. NPDC060031]|uniref:DNA polymerase Y family protein n=1 Tax=Streptomyces sp. NPDC060031 TaxID=3347043 RepID=UPI00369AD3BD